MNATSIDCPDVPDIKSQYPDVDERIRAAVLWTEENCPQKEWTLEEISNIAGLTRERIRQIEWKALKKIRNQVMLICKKDGIDPETVSY